RDFAQDLSGTRSQRRRVQLEIHALQPQRLRAFGDDAAAVIRSEAGQRAGALVDLIRHAVVIAVHDLGLDSHRLDLRHDAIAHDFALDRAAAERHRHAEADAPLGEAVVAGALVPVAEQAALSADSYAGAADVAAHDAEPDVAE